METPVWTGPHIVRENVQERSIKERVDLFMSSSSKLQWDFAQICYDAKSEDLTFGDIADLFMGRYERSTINYAYNVWRDFGLTNRINYSLSFTHYKHALSMGEEADAYLQAAIDEGLSAKAMKRRFLDDKGIVPDSSPSKDDDMLPETGDDDVDPLPDFEDTGGDSVGDNVAAGTDDQQCKSRKEVERAIKSLRYHLARLGYMGEHDEVLNKLEQYSLDIEI